MTRLITDSIQRVTKQIRMLLQNHHQQEKNTLASELPVSIRLPVIIDYILKPKNKVLLSVEFVKYIRLDPVEVQIVKEIAATGKTSLQKTMLELMQIAVSQDRSTQRALTQFQRKYAKAKIEIEVKLNGQFSWEEEQ